MLQRRCVGHGRFGTSRTSTPASAAAEARLLLGDRGAARELADARRACEMRASWALPRALGVALRTRRAWRTAGAPASSCSRSRSDALRDSPALLERAKSDDRARSGHAPCRTIASRPGRCSPRPWISAAGCRARPVAERARAELRAAGGRPRRDRRRWSLEALTPSELRVARMAADGQTNRQIAHEPLPDRQDGGDATSRMRTRSSGISKRGELPNALASAKFRGALPRRELRPRRGHSSVTDDRRDRT